jgi:hypothetical protein
MDDAPTPSSPPQPPRKASPRGGAVEPARRDTDQTPTSPTRSGSQSAERDDHRSAKVLEQNPPNDPLAVAQPKASFPSRPAVEKPDPKSFTEIDPQAERAAQVARLESSLVERYLIKRAPVQVGDLTVGTTEYRFRGDTSRVAFTESNHRLATDANNPTVARSMVDVAEARNWKTLRVSGNEEFRRMVWLEASVRGVKTLGYEPNLADMERLKLEREQRQTNRIEPLHASTSPKDNLSTAKASARGNGGRKSVLVAIEAVLVAKRVPEMQREAIISAAADKLAQRIRDGQPPRVKVYDKTAPSQRPVATPTQEQQRSRERAAPMR